MTPELNSLIASICAVIGAVVALVATGIAASGLRTWQKEMRGKDEYETARRLLRATYKVRNAFEYIRRRSIYLVNHQNLEKVRLSEWKENCSENGRYYQRL